MSLFDQISQAVNQNETPILLDQNEQVSSLDTGGPAQERQTKAGKRPAAKPEQLKFLKPCSICFGREFVHRKNGGFFCTTCQPGIAGHPVIALGHREPPEKVTGLPCAGCGSTTWTKEKDGYQYPDGIIVDGWHCGGDHCRVKLLSGNRKADVNMIEPPESWEQHWENGHADTLPDREREYFRAGYAWIMDHLQELLAAGWTRPALFRRSKFRYPYGHWGAAWLSVWIKSNLQVRLGSRGDIVFTYPSGGRQIEQTAHRPGKG